MAKLAKVTGIIDPKQPSDFGTAIAGPNRVQVYAKHEGTMIVAELDVNEAIATGVSLIAAASKAGELEAERLEVERGKAAIAPNGTPAVIVPP